MAHGSGDRTDGLRAPVAAGGRLSRRSLLAGFGGVGIAATLAACGGSSSPVAVASPASAVDLSATDKTLRWQSWPAYMDYDGGKGSTLRAFEKQSGVKVRYTDGIEGNASFTDTVRRQLLAGKPTGYDLVVLTDWMAGKWIDNGWALPLDKTNIPNWTNLRPQLVDVPFDPGRRYTLPWMSGFAGIGINKKAYRELTGKAAPRTIQDLWDPKLKGQVTVLDEMRDTIGLILLSQGKRITDFSDADFQAALAELQKQVDSGQVKQVTGNNYLDELEKGTVAASTAWSGDLFGNPDLGWVVPESGATYWTDNLLIPAMAAHRLNAERAMNFYYDPANDARLIMGGITYATPVPASQAIVARSDAALARNELVYPTDEFLATTQIFKELTPEQNDQYTRAFNDVIGVSS
jgi:spermidine/putrescine transport system substrate-binding protein